MFIFFFLKNGFVDRKGIDFFIFVDNGDNDVGYYLLKVEYEVDIILDMLYLFIDSSFMNYFCDRYCYFYYIDRKTEVYLSSV